MANKLEGDFYATGNISCGGGILGVTRASLAQEALAAYVIRPGDWRTHDALHALLPGTPATDDLGIASGTFGTDFPYVWAGDQKNNGASNNRRAAVLLRLPPEYVAGQPVRLRFKAGMKTTVASVAATLDVEVYKNGQDLLVDGADLYSGAALTINSTTLADKDFELNASGLQPGDELLARVTIAVNDSGTLTAVDAVIADAALLLSIKG